MKNTQLLLINDMCGYVKVALSDMLPVLSHMGYRIHNLPTALVSDTLNYPKFYIHDTTEYVRQSLAIWEELGFEFDAISTGFIVTEEEARIISDFCHRRSQKGTKVFVDPIMADNGRLYAGVPESTIGLMRSLVECADYAVPNYTEACLLTDTPMAEQITADEARALVDAMLALGAKSVVITSAKVDGASAVIGYDHVAGRQLGLQLGSAEDFHSYEELLDAFHKQIDYFLDIKVRGSNIIESIYANYMPVPFLSVITNDCIATGRDYNAGGARYNTSYLQGVGIGTVTDSLAAIRYQVYDKKNVAMKDLLRALREDFANDPQLLNLVQNHTPKYGNDDDYADAIMQGVFEYYRDAVTGRPNQRGGTYRVNMLPTTCHVYFGEVMLASANGRRAHKPVSEGISPDKGADTNGPTAVLRSCAKMDHLSTGGTLLNQKFTPSVVAGEDGLRQMANLIRAYFNMDGHHIQFNVIDRQTLLDAQAHPEEYKDLIVRVAGYSDHFRNLSRALQDEIIARTEQSFC